MSTAPLCSGLSAGGFTSSPQALAVEIDPVGVMDQAVEDGVGLGGITEHGRAPQSSTGTCLTSQ
jgi:hypothetical protein